MPRYLADTSAWARSSRVADRWQTLIEDDAVAICTPVALELLYSARGKSDYRTLASDLEGFASLPLDERATTMALNTQSELAARSQHRGSKPVDLLIAAVASVHGMTLLHYDRHFDAIARVTGQPMEWLARRGSLD
jgi:hypothetical protein